MKKHLFTKAALILVGLGMLLHYLFLAVIEVPDLRDALKKEVDYTNRVDRWKKCIVEKPMYEVAGEKVVKLSDMKSCDE